MPPAEARSPASLAEAVAGVLAGPAGPSVGAFFDFDGTVIDGSAQIIAWASQAERQPGEISSAGPADR